MKNSQNMATTKKKPLAEIFVNIRHENNNLDFKKNFTTTFQEKKTSNTAKMLLQV